MAKEETQTSNYERVLEVLRGKYGTKFDFSSGDAREMLVVEGGFKRGTVSWALSKAFKEGKLTRLKNGTYVFPKGVEQLELPDDSHEVLADLGDFLKSDLYTKRKAQFHDRFRAREVRFMNVLHSLPPSTVEMRRKLTKVTRTVSCEKITPELAYEFATMREMEGDRQFDINRSVELARSIEVIDLPYLWAVVRMIWNGVLCEFRVNGRTSSWTLLLAPHLIRDNSVAIITTFDCGTDVDMAKYIYRCYDPDISVRSNKDRVDSALSAHPLLSEGAWPASHLNAILSGIKTYATGRHLQHNSHIRPEEMIDSIGPELFNFMRLLMFLIKDNNSITRKNGRQLIQRDLVAGYVWIYKHYPAALLGFLLELRDEVKLDGGNLSVDTPARMFSSTVRSWKPAGSGSTKRGEILSSYEMQGRLRNVWNAWCAGSERCYFKNSLPALLKDGRPPNYPSNLDPKTMSDLAVLLDLINDGKDDEAREYLKACRST